MCVRSHVSFRCLAAKSRSLKAINCSWCRARWSQEDFYLSSPYFMDWVHYVQHSEGIHHSAMEDLSFRSLENICVCLRVVVWICVCTAVTPVFLYVCAFVIDRYYWSHFPLGCGSKYDGCETIKTLKNHTQTYNKTSNVQPHFKMKVKGCAE